MPIKSKFLPRIPCVGGYSKIDCLFFINCPKNNSKKVLAAILVQYKTMTLLSWIQPNILATETIKKIQDDAFSSIKSRVNYGWLGWVLDNVSGMSDEIFVEKMISTGLQLVGVLDGIAEFFGETLFEGKLASNHLFFPCLITRIAQKNSKNSELRLSQQLEAIAVINPHIRLETRTNRRYFILHMKNTQRMISIAWNISKHVQNCDFYALIDSIRHLSAKLEMLQVFADTPLADHSFSSTWETDHINFFDFPGYDLHDSNTRNRLVEGIQSQGHLPINQMLLAFHEIYDLPHDRFVMWRVMIKNYGMIEYYPANHPQYPGKVMEYPTDGPIRARDPYHEENGIYVAQMADNVMMIDPPIGKLREIALIESGLVLKKKRTFSPYKMYRQLAPSSMVKKWYQEYLKSLYTKIINCHQDSLSLKKYFLNALPDSNDHRLLGLDKFDFEILFGMTENEELIGKRIDLILLSFFFIGQYIRFLHGDTTDQISQTFVKQNPYTVFLTWQYLAAHKNQEQWRREFSVASWFYSIKNLFQVVDSLLHFNFILYSSTITNDGTEIYTDIPLLDDLFDKEILHNPQLENNQSLYKFFFSKTLDPDKKLSNFQYISQFKSKWDSSETSFTPTQRKIFHNAFKFLGSGPDSKICLMPNPKALDSLIHRYQKIIFFPSMGKGDWNGPRIDRLLTGTSKPHQPTIVYLLNQIHTFLEDMGIDFEISPFEAFDPATEIYANPKERQWSFDQYVFLELAYQFMLEIMFPNPSNQVKYHRETSHFTKKTPYNQRQYLEWFTELLEKAHLNTDKTTKTTIKHLLRHVMPYAEFLSQIKHQMVYENNMRRFSSRHAMWCDDALQWVYYDSDYEKSMQILLKPLGQAFWDPLARTNHPLRIQGLLGCKATNKYYHKYKRSILFCVPTFSVGYYKVEHDYRPKHGRNDYGDRFLGVNKIGDKHWVLVNEFHYAIPDLVSQERIRRNSLKYVGGELLETMGYTSLAHGKKPYGPKKDQSFLASLVQGFAISYYCENINLFEYYTDVNNKEIQYLNKFAPILSKDMYKTKVNRAHLNRRVTHEELIFFDAVSEVVKLMHCIHQKDPTAILTMENLEEMADNNNLLELYQKIDNILELSIAYGIHLSFNQKHGNFTITLEKNKVPWWFNQFQSGNPMYSFETISLNTYFAEYLAIVNSLLVEKNPAEDGKSAYNVELQVEGCIQPKLDYHSTVFNQLRAACPPLTSMMTKNTFDIKNRQYLFLSYRPPWWDSVVE